MRGAVEDEKARGWREEAEAGKEEQECTAQRGYERRRGRDDQLTLPLPSPSTRFFNRNLRRSTPLLSLLSPTSSSSPTLKTDDFGFSHLLWVYSGRRGIHCWVSDPAALALTDEQRRAIVNYIEVIKGDKKVGVGRSMHPMLG